MLIIHMFILLCDRGAITSSLRSFEPLVCHSEMGKSLRVVPIGTTNKLAGLFFSLSHLMLSVMQGSYKYQLSSRYLQVIGLTVLNRTPSLPFQKQTLYPLGHLGGSNLFRFTILPPLEQVIISKCAVDTFENAILLLEQFLNDYFFTFT